MTPAPPIRIGVFGAGRIGTSACPHRGQRILGAKLAAICDINLDAARALG